MSAGYHLQANGARRSCKGARNMLFVRRVGSTMFRCGRPGFPLALPFSQTYPLCCIDIRSFTEQYYQFSDGFAEQHRDIDDVLRKVVRAPRVQPHTSSPILNLPPGTRQSAYQASQRKYTKTPADDQQPVTAVSDRRQRDVFPDGMLGPRDSAGHTPVRRHERR